MFYSPDSSIGTFLVHAKHVFDYLDQQPAARSLLVRYGMDEIRLQEGKALLLQVQNSHWEMRNQVRQQKASTVSLHDDWALARLLYRRHRQAAREVVGSNASQLLRTRSRNYASWLADAQEFYSALLNNADYLQKLAAIDVTPDQLQRASQQIENMMMRKATQTQNRERARTNKQTRDLHLNEAKGWFAVLMAAAQVAFRQQRGMLEALQTLPEPLSKEMKELRKTKASAKPMKTEQVALLVPVAEIAV
ncbi:MAG: hypothetical protein U0175_30040 [Caldilineaceae bacterium]